MSEEILDYYREESIFSEAEGLRAFAKLWNSKDENFNKLIIKILNEKYDIVYNKEKIDYNDIGCMLPFYHKDFIEYKPETKQYFIVNYTLRDDLILEGSLENEEYMILDEKIDIPIRVNYKLKFKNENELRKYLKEVNIKELKITSDEKDIEKDKILDTIKKMSLEPKFYEGIRLNSDGWEIFNFMQNFLVFNYNNTYEYIYDIAKKGILYDEIFDAFFDNGSIIKAALYGGITFEDLKNYLDFIKLYKDYYVYYQFKTYGIFDFIKQYRPEIYDEVVEYYTE